MRKAMPAIMESTAELQQRMKREPDPKKRQRLHALYLAACGHARHRKAIATLLGVHRHSVAAWFAAYAEGGLAQALRYDVSTRPSTGGSPTPLCRHYKPNSRSPMALPDTTRFAARTKRGQAPHKLDIFMHRMLSYVGCVHQLQGLKTMHTTMNIDEQLLMQAKKAQAATLGVPLAQLIEDALRASLMRRENVEQRGRVRLITMQGTGTRPGIDLDNSHTLLEIMEQ